MDVNLLACVMIALMGAGADASDDAGLPALNVAVLRFCQEHNGEQIGNGQCAAVAEGALGFAGARSRGFEPAKDEHGSPVWGTRVDRVEDVLPGDIIQFHQVRLLDVRPNGTRYVRLYAEHTAIVARVRGGGMFDLYEQNVITPGADKKRRGQLRIRDVNFRGMLEGTVTAYRPMLRDRARSSGPD